MIPPRVNLGLLIMNMTYAISRPTSVDVVVPTSSRLMPAWTRAAIAMPEVSSLRTTWKLIGNFAWVFTFETTTQDMSELLRLEAAIAGKGFPVHWEAPIPAF